MSLENLQTLSKLKKICVQKLFCLFYGLAARIFFVKKTCARIFFWVWREFGDSPNPVLMLIKEKTWKLTSSKHFPVSSKLFPNSYVQYLLFFFFEKERSELEYSPNSFETHLSLEHQHTKNRMFFCGQKLKLSKFCCEFGVSLEILQTHSKLKCFRFVLAIFSLLIFLVGKEWVSNINTQKKNVFHVAQNISIFFCGRKVKFSKFGCELRVWIQVHSKIT